MHQYQHMTTVRPIHRFVCPIVHWCAWWYQYLFSATASSCYSVVWSVMLVGWSWELRKVMMLDTTFQFAGCCWPTTELCPAGFQQCDGCLSDDWAAAVNTATRSQIDWWVDNVDKEWAVDMAWIQIWLTIDIVCLLSWLGCGWFAWFVGDRQLAIQQQSAGQTWPSGEQSQYESVST